MLAIIFIIVIVIITVYIQLFLKLWDWYSFYATIDQLE